jgi:hypothetical protein
VVDVLLAVLVVALLGAVGLALLVAVTVVPFVVALQRAERRGVSSGRAGALALATSLLGPLAALYLALRTSAPCRSPCCRCWSWPPAPPLSRPRRAGSDGADATRRAPPDQRVSSTRKASASRPSAGNRCGR